MGWDLYFLIGFIYSLVLTYSKRNERPILELIPMFLISNMVLWPLSMLVHKNCLEDHFSKREEEYIEKD